ncbi:hypothetical protein U9M48_007647 [Paspalum notatum var. saurae]|uniref:Uncharacterized protein n=1 Tax=Paspalum notatum var. saurae TaxID=547442 RepID=A0AAQ3WBW0_PASNO
MRASPGGLLLQSSFFAADGSAISSLSFLALYIVVVLSGGRCLQRSSSNPLQSRLPLRFADFQFHKDSFNSLVIPHYSERSFIQMHEDHMRARTSISHL